MNRKRTAGGPSSQDLPPSAPASAPPVPKSSLPRKRFLRKRYIMPHQRNMAIRMFFSVLHLIGETAGSYDKDATGPIMSAADHQAAREKLALYYYNQIEQSQEHLKARPEPHLMRGAPVIKRRGRDPIFVWLNSETPREALDYVKTGRYNWTFSMFHGIPATTGDYHQAEIVVHSELLRLVPSSSDLYELLKAGHSGGYLTLNRFEETTKILLSNDLDAIEFLRNAFIVRGMAERSLEDDLRGLKVCLSLFDLFTHMLCQFYKELLEGAKTLKDASLFLIRYLTERIEKHRDFFSKPRNLMVCIGLYVVRRADAWKSYGKLFTGSSYALAIEAYKSDSTELQLRKSFWSQSKKDKVEQDKDWKNVGQLLWTNLRTSFLVI